MDSKVVNNPWSLFGFFLVLPLLVSFLLAWPFDALLEIKALQNFVYVSGYLFTASSLLLVFILFKRAKVSDYKKDEASKYFLENDAFVDLFLALTTIKNCIENDEVTNLSVNCLRVRHIHTLLVSYGSDTELKAYQKKIKSIYNLLAKHGLFTIGFASETIKLKEMSVQKKEVLVSEIGELLFQLEQRSSLNEQ